MSEITQTLWPVSWLLELLKVIDIKNNIDSVIETKQSDGEYLVPRWRKLSGYAYAESDKPPS